MKMTGASQILHQHKNAYMQVTCGISLCHLKETGNKIPKVWPVTKINLIISI